MNNILFAFLVLFPIIQINKMNETPEHFRTVDQLIWVVNDLDNVVDKWKELGFQQINEFDIVTVKSQNNKKFEVKLAIANLGGANVTWIQPYSGSSVFSDFNDLYGNGVMSIVHRINLDTQFQSEIEFLTTKGIDVLDVLTFTTPKGNFNLTLMDTYKKGKYVLGYVNSENSVKLHQDLSAVNRYDLKINQYAFAINKIKEISDFWNTVRFPKFQINYPELGETTYYNKIVEHKLIQGWQYHGEIAYEWCIPVKGPIVYTDHINLHGEGFHHLAFSVDNRIDEIINDYESIGYQNTMGGTWGQKGELGSGRYEYIDLENAGGISIEFLWNYKKE